MPAWLGSWLCQDAGDHAHTVDMQIAVGFDDDVVAITWRRYRLDVDG